MGFHLSIYGGCMHHRAFWASIPNVAQTSKETCGAANSNTVMHQCLKYGESRYKKKDGDFSSGVSTKGHLRKILWYLPIIPRLKKNVTDSVIETLLNIQDKTKDGVNARLYLIDIDIRQQLTPIHNQLYGYIDFRNNQ
ncbi:hypothetical protein CR513_49807, partial [Mucuna pruriens]